MKSIRGLLKRGQRSKEKDNEAPDDDPKHLSPTTMGSRPKLPTPITSDDDDDDDDSYDDVEEATSNQRCPIFDHKDRINLPIQTRENTQQAQCRLLFENLPKKPLLPPKEPRRSPNPQKHQTNNQLPTVSMNSHQTNVNKTKVNVVKPTIKCLPKIESRLQKEIIYVHKQRQSGFNLLEISLQDSNGRLKKPPVPRKPGTGNRILIKKPPPPLPIKLSVDENISDNENNAVKSVKTLSVYKLAEELSMLNVERCVIENVKRLKIDGAFICNMGQSLISSSLQANELDTLKIYQFVYHGWKPLM